MIHDRPKQYRVYWRDSAEHNSRTWWKFTDLEEEIEVHEKYAIHETVGWLIAETKHYIFLVNSLWRNEDNDIPSVSGLNSIPTGCVIRKERIK